MSDTLRFKPSLVNGSWPDNPEPLVRCSDGDYCLYSDYKKLEAERDAYKEKLEKIRKECDIPYLNRDRLAFANDIKSILDN